MPRKTVYAATLIAILALAGGWTLAAGTTAVQGPAQLSSVTVTAPTDFGVAAVGTLQILTVSSALVTELSGSPAGIQAGAGNGLNSTAMNNAVLPACAGWYCAGNYSAVDESSALALGDTAEQVELNVTQAEPSGSPVGFDVQVEIIYTATGVSGSAYAFGTGYFDTGVSTFATGLTFYAVNLYVDLGTSALNLPSIQNVVITMNQCLVATSCP